MSALEALHTRNSVALLCEPGPSEKQLDNILLAGLRASDHRRLRPWRFLVIQGGARLKLGQSMIEISLRDNPDMPPEEQKKIAAKTLRAPLIIVVAAQVRTDEKVPEIEQLLAAGGAAQLMVLAAHAQGLGSIWRTGKFAYDKRTNEVLGLDSRDQIVGFLYMGTAKAVKPLSEINTADFVTHWL
jgi:nitroreductase